MIFNTLQEKCEYYRSLTDYRLTPNSLILVMIDGKNFSRLIKNKFEKPFSDWFINAMNETAEHVAKQIQNCVGAYVQSDEITFLIKDNGLIEMPFDGRLCKLLSIVPSLATSYFTKKMIEYDTLEQTKKTCDIQSEQENFHMSMPDYVFDCKAWTVPNKNDAMAWFLYRQIDCVRNSKQQFCQTYLPHKMLNGLNTDEQVKLCLSETGHNWNEISYDKKYGRFLYKYWKQLTNDNGESYQRRTWNIVSHDLTNSVCRDELLRKWLDD